MTDYFGGNLCGYNDGKKAHCVVITVQVDMNLIFISERIMKLQPSKKMNHKNFRFRR